MSLVGSSSSIVKPTNESLLFSPTNTSNEIASSPDDPLVPKIAAGVVAVIAVLSAILNGLVIIVFIKNPTVRNRFNYYLLNLAVTDFILTVLDMPIMVVQTFYNYWPFSASYCTFFLYLDYTFASGTMYAVLLISLDRFYAVFFPMRYRDHRSKKATFCAIGFSWLFLHAVMLPYVLIDRQVIDANDEASCYVDQPLQYTYGFVVQFLMYWTPLALVTLVYIIICLKLIYNQIVHARKLKPGPAIATVATATTGVHSGQTGTSGQQSHQNHPSADSAAARAVQDQRQKRDRRKYVALSCLTVCVVVGWAPANFYYTIGLFSAGYSSMILYAVANCLQFGTCLVNPIVYHQSIPEIKRAMNDLVKSVQRKVCGCFTSSA